jgi:hypothetical protein
MISTIPSAGQLLAVLLIAVPVVVAVCLAATVLVDRKPAAPKPPRATRPPRVLYPAVPDIAWSVWDPFGGGIRSVTTPYIPTTTKDCQ